MVSGSAAPGSVLRGRGVFTTGSYTRGAGVWDLAGALSALCAKVVRRRAEGHGSDDHENEEARRER